MAKVAKLPSTIGSRAFDKFARPVGMTVDQLPYSVVFDHMHDFVIQHAMYAGLTKRALWLGILGERKNPQTSHLYRVTRRNV